MEIEEIRRFNLWAIAHPGGYSDQGVKALALKTDKTEQRIRHLIARHPTAKTYKNIGSAAARSFEKSLGLDIGWLDHPHPELWASHQEFIDANVREPSFSSYDAQPQVPLISWVKAGEFCEAHDPYALGEADEWYPRPKGAGNKTYALTVVGDSMTGPYPGGRSYPEGSIIFVDPDQEVLPGMRGIFKLPDSNEVTFKELVSDAGRLYLKPLNPQYDKIKVTDEMVKCGKVIGSFLPE